MSRYALVDPSGNVVSVAVWDGETPWVPSGGLVPIEDVNEIASPGGRYENGVFIAPAQPPVPPAPVPSLTPRQIRLGLLGAGITETQVDAALAGNASGLIEWKYATVYVRDHPLIASLAGSFGLSPEQVDALWLSAAQL